MNRLDPEKLFKQIATDIPRGLHASLFVTGSLAAAYAFRAKLESNAVNTKDADLVVHPAGNVKSCAEMALDLILIGWKKTDDCFSQKDVEPVDKLRAIRLYPPDSTEYFVEFLI